MTWAWVQSQCGWNKAESFRFAICPAIGFWRGVNYVDVRIIISSGPQHIELINLVVGNNVAEFNLVFLSQLVEKIHHGRRGSRRKRCNNCIQVFILSNTTFNIFNLINYHLNTWKVIILLSIVEVQFYMPRSFLGLNGTTVLFLNLLAIVVVIYLLWEIYYFCDFLMFNLLHVRFDLEYWLKNRFWTPRCTLS